jgi:hypothetical protein
MIHDVCESCQAKVLWYKWRRGSVLLSPKNDNRIYIASRFKNREGVKQLTAKLATAKPPIHAIQTWPNELPDADRVKSAVRDLEQIDSVDTVLVWTDECELTPGGMNFETGYAFGTGKNIIVVGPRVHIFLDLAGNDPHFRHFATLQDYFKTLTWE